jgi:hypothetical protein
MRRLTLIVLALPALAGCGDRSARPCPPYRTPALPTGGYVGALAAGELCAHRLAHAWAASGLAAPVLVDRVVGRCQSHVDEAGIRLRRETPRFPDWYLAMLRRRNLADLRQAARRFVLRAKAGDCPSPDLDYSHPAPAPGA